jgi:subtilisin family serine protease
MKTYSRHALISGLVILLGSQAHSQAVSLSPDDRVTQKPDGGDVALAEVRALIRLADAVKKYNALGKGCTVAVLDSGINPTHKDFGKRIVAQVNYTSDNGSRKSDARDGDGHGTHVAGIIAANSVNEGIAPEARIVAMKVLDNSGNGDFGYIRAALGWVLKNRKKHQICAANISVQDGKNTTSISRTDAGKMGELITQLRAARIAVVVAAGNEYFKHQEPGMSFPAIIPQAISVGAVYDAVQDDEPIGYGNGAAARTTGKDRVTPFTQRLPDDVGGIYRTDVFGPGATVTSTGAENDTGQSDSSGTSQPAPAVAGVVLLAQSYWKARCKKLPTVDQVERWLRGGVPIHDGDDEDDNVKHTNATFIRVDALSALEAAEKELGSCKK